MLQFCLCKPLAGDSDFRRQPRVRSFLFWLGANWCGRDVISRTQNNVICHSFIIPLTSTACIDLTFSWFTIIFWESTINFTVVVVLFSYRLFCICFVFIEFQFRIQLIRLFIFQNTIKSRRVIQDFLVCEWVEALSLFYSGLWSVSLVCCVEFLISFLIRLWADRLMFWPSSQLIWCFGFSWLQQALSCVGAQRWLLAVFLSWLKLFANDQLLDHFWDERLLFTQEIQKLLSICSCNWKPIVELSSFVLKFSAI